MWNSLESARIHRIPFEWYIWILYWNGSIWINCGANWWVKKDWMLQINVNRCGDFFFTQLIIKYLIENRLHPFHSKSNGGDGRSRVRHWTETHMIWVYLLYFYKSYRLQWKSNWIWLGMDKNKAKQNKTKQIEKWFIKSSAFDG